MGWLFQERPSNVRQYLEERLTWETETSKNRCLDMVLSLTVMYAAVETIQKETNDRRVWAAVFQIRYVPGDDPYNFGYKDMEESMGPYQTGCPARILSLLTPTDNENARRWRAACRERLARKISVGSVIEFQNPVSFNDGFCGRRFTVEMSRPLGKRRRKVLRAENGRLYRVRSLPNRGDWKVLEDTLVCTQGTLL